MRFYLCSSTDKEDVIKIIEIANCLKANGNIITREWWNEMDGDKNQYAQMDLVAIRECDCFLMYNGNRKSSGKFIELGIAIAFNKPIYVLGNQLTSIFKFFTQYIGDY